MDTNRKNQLTAFDAQLRALALAAPSIDVLRDVNRLINKFRRRYGTSYSQKKEEVLKRIADGAAYFDELCDETGFAPRFVSKILGELVEAKQVRMKKVSFHRTGRPRKMYLPLAE